MGDVFNAMNRPPCPPASSTPACTSGAPADPLVSSAPSNETGSLAQAFSSLTIAEPAATPLPPAVEPSSLTTTTTTPTHPIPDDFYAPQIVVHHDRGSVITEQYRAIRTQIMARAKQRPMKTHVITSSAPDEGKTVTCINLGLAMAEMRNQRTLLLECDLRRPSFDTYFHRHCRPGLLQFLRGELDDIDPAIYPTGYDNLHFIPAGARETTQSTELLGSPKMAQLLDRLRDRFDMIFIDTPPVITVTDACILGASADETLLVVRLNKTPAEMIERAKRLLRAANCQLAGVVLTHHRPTIGKEGYGDSYSRYSGR